MDKLVYHTLLGQTSIRLNYPSGHNDPTMVEIIAHHGNTTDWAYGRVDFAPPFVVTVFNSESWHVRMRVTQTVDETRCILPLRDLDILYYGKRYGIHGLNFTLCGDKMRLYTDMSDFHDELRNIRAGPEEYGDPTAYEFIQIYPTTLLDGPPLGLGAIKYGTRVDGKWTFAPFITVCEADLEEINLAFDANNEGYPECTLTQLHSRNAISDTPHDGTIDVD